MKDYYRILEVHAEASQEVIKKAYQTLAQKYHPDKHIPSKKKWAGEKFKELSEAYHVLAVPVKRREFDRSGYSDKIGESNIEERRDEEAYFYYRMGIEHLNKSSERGLLGISLGRRKSDLLKAGEDFKTIIDEYPASKYAEDAHYHYIFASMLVFDYSEKYQLNLKEAFDSFFIEYPRSKWEAEVRIEFAKFNLLKKKDYNKAREQLSKIMALYSESSIIQEAEVLLSYIQMKEKGPYARKA